MKARIIDIITFTQEFAGHTGDADIKLHIEDLNITGKFDKKDGCTYYFIGPDQCILVVAEDGYPLKWNQEALREVNIDHPLNNIASTQASAGKYQED